jgi:hypothetical protein
LFSCLAPYPYRWKKQYLSASGIDLKQSVSDISKESSTPSWAERQTDYRGINPMLCPNCNQELTFVGAYFGNWKELQLLFETVGKDPIIPLVLLPP